jgi:hypothetical protein
LMWIWQLLLKYLSNHPPLCLPPTPFYPCPLSSPHLPEPLLSHTTQVLPERVTEPVLYPTTSRTRAPFGGARKKLACHGFLNRNLEKIYAYT